MNLRLARSSSLALLLAALPLSSQTSFPAPVARGPLGGAGIGIAIDPANPSEILVIKYTLGLFRSLDGGLSFEPTGTGLSGEIQNLTQDPKDPRRLLVADGTQIFESTDFGATWSLLPLVAANTVNGLSIPSAGNDVLAFDAWNVYHSDDDGATWTVADAVVPFSGDIYDAVAYAPSDPSIAYSGTLRRGVLKSTDGGASWSDPGPFSNWAQAVSVSPTDADVVFSASLDGAYRSLDGGLTFGLIASGLTNLDNGEFFAWEPDGSRLWYGLLDGLFYTTDLGITWFDANAGFPPTRPIGFQLAFDGLGNVYLAAESGSLGGGGGGLFLTPAGASSWDHIGFLEVTIHDAMVAEPGGERVIGVLDGVYSGAPGSSLSPTAWQFGIGAETHALAVDPTDPTRWLAAGVGAFLDNAQVMVLTGNGTGYFKSYERSGAGTVQDVVFDPFDANRVLAGIFPSLFGNEGLILSNDGGNSFVDVPGTIGWATRAIAFDPHNPGRVLQLSDNNQWSGSLDGGQTWIGRRPAWPATGRAVLLAYDPFVPFRLYRGDAGSGLWRSDDNGETWTSLGVSLNEDSDLELHPDMPGLLWVGDGAGKVLVSGDFGDTFLDAMDVPQGSVATALALDTADGSLLVGTLDASTWELPQASPLKKLGPGTAGRGGFVPRHYTAGGLPQLGNAGFQLVGDQIRGGALVYLALSFTEASLPAFGGTVYFSNPAGVPQLVASGNGAGGEGSFSYPVPLPSTPSLAGLELVTQFAVIDDDAVSHPNIVLSDGLRTTLVP